MYRVGIIGVGRGGTGVGAHSIGRAHAHAYSQHGNCQIVAAADISADNLADFAAEYDVGLACDSHEEMLGKANIDIVSVATYAGLHREMVLAAASAGVQGIWCEKPFALSMDDGRAMLDACERSGVRLVVNHQRRYLPTFRRAKQLLHEGAIGQSVEFAASLPGWDLMEWGTHWLDMFRFFADDQPVTWVMGQARCTGAKRGYGHVMEEHAMAYFSFADGTRGLLDGGIATNGEYAMRLVGTEGLIDVLSDGSLRILNDSGWRHENSESTLSNYRDQHVAGPMVTVLTELTNWIETGSEPEVSGQNALASAEIYLAAYESARRGDRVDLPLTAQSEFPLAGLAAATQNR